MKVKTRVDFIPETIMPYLMRLWGVPGEGAAYNHRAGASFG
jgi:hypothetical protein